MTKHYKKMTEKQQNLYTLLKNNRNNRKDAERFAYLFSGIKTKSSALDNIKKRLLNGDVPPLHEVRKAVDECRAAPDKHLYAIGETRTLTGLESYPPL